MFYICGVLALYSQCLEDVWHKHGWLAVGMWISCHPIWSRRRYIGRWLESWITKFLHERRALPFVLHSHDIRTKYREPNVRNEILKKTNMADGQERVCSESMITYKKLHSIVTALPSVSHEVKESSQRKKETNISHLLIRKLSCC